MAAGPPPSAQRMHPLYSVSLLLFRVAPSAPLAMPDPSGLEVMKVVETTFVPADTGRAGIMTKPTRAATAIAMLFIVLAPFDLDQNRKGWSCRISSRFTARINVDRISSRCAAVIWTMADRRDAASWRVQ